MPKAARKMVMYDKWKALGRAIGDPRLNGTDSDVFYRLLDHHNAETGRCFPGQKTLAMAIGATPRTVRNSLKKLEENNYVRTLGQGSGGSSNRYALNIYGVEDFCHAGGKKLPKQRKDSSYETKKEKEKETGEPAGGKNDCSKISGLAPKASKPPDRTAGKLQEKLVELFGGNSKGWDVLMAVRTDVLERLEAAYLVGEMGIPTIKDKILKHLKEAEQQSNT